MIQSRLHRLGQLIPMIRSFLAHPLFKCQYKHIEILSEFCIFPQE